MPTTYTHDLFGKKNLSGASGRNEAGNPGAWGFVSHWPSRA